MEEITEEAAELVERVAGLDTGKASLVCCVQVPHEPRPGRYRRQVRTFATTTGQLLELRDWLAAEGVTRCVMEATFVPEWLASRGRPYRRLRPVGSMAVGSP